MSQPDRLARSARELEAARLDRDSGFTEQACSHAYYAAFYAAREVVTAAGKSAKSHSGTLQLFGDVVRELGGPTEARALLSRLQKTREETTYQALQASAEDADDAIGKAEQVIAAAGELLERIVKE